VGCDVEDPCRVRALRHRLEVDRAVLQSVVVREDQDLAVPREWRVVDWSHMCVFAVTTDKCLTKDLTTRTLRHRP
jgi:hypothetical protein